MTMKTGFEDAVSLQKDGWTVRYNGMIEGARWQSEGAARIHLGHLQRGLATPQPEDRSDAVARTDRQAALTRDAWTRGYKPGALMLMVNGSEVLLTSWPWLEGEGEEEHAAVMARTEPDNPMSNRELPYYSMVRKLGEKVL
jgi:hypothetical protein